MSQGPAAVGAARVPRSRLDDNYAMGVPLPEVRVGTAIVVSIDGDTCTVLLFDEEVSGVVWLGVNPPVVGSSVELESRGDLLVIPNDADLDLFLEGMADDAEHIVSDEDPGKPPGELVNIAGSMRATDTWDFDANAHGWQRELAATGVGFRAWQAAGTPGTGILWSTETFDVAPGDVLDFSALASKTGGADATLDLAVCYGSNSVTEPDTLVDDVVTYGTPVAITGPQVAFATTATVPAALTGTRTPATARVGVRLTGAGTSDLIVDSATLTQTQASWPIGSLWLNPVAGDALPTVATTAQTSSTATSLTYQGSPSQWGRFPVGNKALVTAPPDCGGVVMAWANFTITPVTGNTTSQAIHFVVEAGLDYLNVQAPYTRLATSTFSGNNQMPVQMMGWARVGPSQTVEMVPKYQYQTDPSTTGVLNLRSYAMTVMFIPTATSVSGASQPAPISYWDGDSWRPGTLDAAAMNLTKAATVVEAAKTPTTTTLTRSASQFKIGIADTVTLTATVAPTAADGSVTFYWSPTGTPSWTAIGSAPLDGSNTAVKTFTRTSPGSVVFRADYAGSSAHQSSISAVTATTSWLVKHTATVTNRADWMQAYDADGTKAVGAHISQGFWEGSGKGSRRSCIGFSITKTAGAVDEVCTSAVLACQNWEVWDNNSGTLVVGSHTSTGAPPANWPDSKVTVDQSRHSLDEGAFKINISSWAAALMMRADFHGIVLGPSPTPSTIYKGRAADAAAGDLFQLEVTTDYWSTS